MECIFSLLTMRCSGLSDITSHTFVLLNSLSRGVESESPGVRVLSRSRSLSFEGDSDSGPCLFYLDFRVNLMQFV